MDACIAQGCIDLDNPSHKVSRYLMNTFVNIFRITWKSLNQVSPQFCRLFEELEKMLQKCIDGPLKQLGIYVDGLGVQTRLRQMKEFKQSCHYLFYQKLKAAILAQFLYWEFRPRTKKTFRFSLKQVSTWSCMMVMWDGHVG